MAAAAFIGYLLLSGGPTLVIWSSFIANKSFLVLLALASAFYWLVSLLAVSILFRGFVPFPRNAALYGLALLVAVLVQEAFRYGGYLIHRQIVQQLSLASNHLRLPTVTVEDKRLLALAQGMGHALAQNTFLYYSFVYLAAGKGTKYVDSCPQMSYFLASGLLSLAFSLLHCFSMVVAFHGYETRSGGMIGAVGGLHLVASLTTLFNMIQGGCIPVACITLVQGSLAALAAAAICYRQPAGSRNMRIEDRPGLMTSNTQP